MATTMHLGIAKEYLKRIIRQEGPAAVLSGAGAEMETEEALAAIEADPREIFCDCSCEKNPDGSCSGKKLEGDDDE